jgi:PPOX class probable F420-dependent enzyme
MSPQEALAFLAEGGRTGKLGVTHADGAPHVVPVWFVVDGDEIVFTTGRSTVKGRALRRDPRVALCADDEGPPFSFVAVQGSAEAIEGASDMLEWTTRIAERYMGPERAGAFGRRNAAPEDLLVRVRPTRIWGFADMTD